MSKDPRIDAYIENAMPFAQPILKRLRKLIHKANPDVVEVIKWGMPFFDYKGPYCNMAAFKQHVTFGFWKYNLIHDPHKMLEERKNKGGAAMGNLGRVTALEDLPPDEVIIEFLKQAKKLNDDGVKVSKPKKEPKPAAPIPDYLLAALKKNPQARQHFDNFSPSAKNEYIDWLADAKTDATRQKRLADTITWVSQGKKRNWKYEMNT